MKKIGIITFHRALNYGAVLQTYALRTSLEKYFNGDVEVVDYRCDSIEAGRNLKKRLMKKNFIKGFLSTALMLYKRKNFDRFLKSNIAISKKSSIENRLESHKMSIADLLLEAIKYGIIKLQMTTQRSF